jgi:ABC-2 type transport system permease protein
MKKENIAAALLIPEDFGITIQQSFSNSNVSNNLSFYFDPSQQTTTSIIQSILLNVINDYNLGLTGGAHIIGVDEKQIIGEDFEFIDFFIPGMIGFTIMTSCIYGSIERNTKYRKDGILRKMLTMPITRTDWIFAKMLFMLFLSFLSTTVILIFGIVVWSLSITISLFSIVLIIATSFMFSGMGMIISRFVKDEETADMAGGAITFPMMFLAGTFFPLDQMPDFLRTIAQFLPLYYVNEGFRNAMIFADFNKTIWFTGLVLLFASLFFISGAFLSKWDED